MSEVITLVDDVDGTTEGVTRRSFSADGHEYEIDLGKESLERLNEAQKTLAEFVVSARLIAPKRNRHKTALSQLSPSDREKLRADLGRGPRGTIPDDVVQKWVLEQRRDAVYGEPIKHRPERAENPSASRKS